jgi:hypothetical protein
MIKNTNYRIAVLLKSLNRRSRYQKMCIYAGLNGAIYLLYKNEEYV